MKKNTKKNIRKDNATIKNKIKSYHKELVRMYKRGKR